MEIARDLDPGSLDLDRKPLPTPLLLPAVFAIREYLGGERSVAGVELEGGTEVVGEGVTTGGGRVAVPSKAMCRVEPEGIRQG